METENGANGKNPFALAFGKIVVGSGIRMPPPYANGFIFSRLQTSAIVGGTFLPTQAQLRQKNREGRDFFGVCEKNYGTTWAIYGEKLKQAALTLPVSGKPKWLWDDYRPSATPAKAPKTAKSAKVSKPGPKKQVKPVDLQSATDEEAPHSKLIEPVKISADSPDKLPKPVAHKTQPEVDPSLQGLSPEDARYLINRVAHIALSSPIDEPVIPPEALAVEVLVAEMSSTPSHTAPVTAPEAAAPVKKLREVKAKPAKTAKLPDFPETNILPPAVVPAAPTMAFPEPAAENIPTPVAVTVKEWVQSVTVEAENPPPIIAQPAKPAALPDHSEEAVPEPTPSTKPGRARKSKNTAPLPAVVQADEPEKRVPARNGISSDVKIAAPPKPLPVVVVAPKATNGNGHIEVAEVIKQFLNGKQITADMMERYTTNAHLKGQWAVVLTGLATPALEKRALREICNLNNWRQPDDPQNIARRLKKEMEPAVN